MALIRANSGGGGGSELTVLATSRSGDANKAYNRNYTIPSGITKVVVCFVAHKSSSVSGAPTVKWNGTTLTSDNAIVYDYTGIGGTWSVSRVLTFTLDGSGGTLAVSGTDTYYDSCCIY